MKAAQQVRTMMHPVIDSVWVIWLGRLAGQTNSFSVWKPSLLGWFNNDTLPPCSRIHWEGNLRAGLMSPSEWPD
jgi:hypothetical protein